MSALLEAKKLSRSFGGIVAVDNVSFSIDAGEIFGLIGPNGAGKTTLFNLMTGLTPQSSGEFFFEGSSLTGLPSHRIAALGIARTFQNIRLFRGLSALDNVKIARHARTQCGIVRGILGIGGSRAEEKGVHERGMEILKLVGLDDRAGEQAGRFSYGDQRRIEIARALALDPKVLLLDEPAAGMNATEKHKLTDFIRDIKALFSLTILIIEHHVPLVMDLCDRVAVLDFGEMLAMGSPDDIQKNPAVIEAYLGVP